MVAAASDPGSSMGATTRKRLADEVDYLARAREVVRVVTDLPVTGVDLAVADLSPDERALADLAERWGLDSPVRRLREALSRSGSGR